MLASVVQSQVISSEYAFTRFLSGSMFNLKTLALNILIIVTAKLNTINGTLSVSPKPSTALFTNVLSTPASTILTNSVRATSSSYNSSSILRTTTMNPSSLRVSSFNASTIRTTGYHTSFITSAWNISINGNSARTTVSSIPLSSISVSIGRQSTTLLYSLSSTISSYMTRITSLETFTAVSQSFFLKTTVKHSLSSTVALLTVTRLGTSQLPRSIPSSSKYGGTSGSIYTVATSPLYQTSLSSVASRSVSSYLTASDVRSNTAVTTSNVITSVTSTTMFAVASTALSSVPSNLAASDVRSNTAVTTFNVITFPTSATMFAVASTVLSGVLASAKSTPRSSIIPISDTYTALTKKASSLQTPHLQSLSQEASVPIADSVSQLSTTRQYLTPSSSSSFSSEIGEASASPSEVLRTLYGPSTSLFPASLSISLSLVNTQEIAPSATVNSFKTHSPSRLAVTSKFSPSVSLSSVYSFKSSLPPSSPNNKNNKKSNRETIIFAAAGGGGGLLLIVMIFCVILACRRTKRTKGQQSAKSAEEEEKFEGDIDFKSKWSTMRQNDNFAKRKRETLMNLVLYGETNDAFVSEETTDTAIVNISRNSVHDESEVDDNDNEEMMPRCGTFSGRAGRVKNGNQSLIEIVNERKKIRKSISEHVDENNEDKLVIERVGAQTSDSKENRESLSSFGGKKDQSLKSSGDKDSRESRTSLTSFGAGQNTFQEEKLLSNASEKSTDHVDCKPESDEDARTEETKLDKESPLEEIEQAESTENTANANEIICAYSC